MDPSIILEAANTAGERLADQHAWRFTWRALRKGGRAMREGATWTLLPDGTASFDATVAGAADGDAWVIWHVDLLDGDGFVVGSLATEDPVDGDWRKFVMVMPRAGTWYRFAGSASFDPALWDAIARLKMYLS